MDLENGLYDTSDQVERNVIGQGLPPGLSLLVQAPKKIFNFFRQGMPLSLSKCQRRCRRRRASIDKENVTAPQEVEVDDIER